MRIINVTFRTHQDQNRLALRKVFIFLDKRRHFIFHWIEFKFTSEKKTWSLKFSLLCLSVYFLVAENLFLLMKCCTTL